MCAADNDDELVMITMMITMKTMTSADVGPRLFSELRGLFSVALQYQSILTVSEKRASGCIDTLVQFE